MVSVCFLCQDDYIEALGRLQMAVTRAYKINSNIKFEVFIHKVDGLSDDNKIETQRDIHQRSTDDLAEAGLESVHLRCVFVGGGDTDVCAVLSCSVLGGYCYLFLPCPVPGGHCGLFLSCLVLGLFGGYHYLFLSCPVLGGYCCLFLSCPVFGIYCCLFLSYPVLQGYLTYCFSFHLTSIYDHSIFEAFSKVVQKLIPQLPTLENLLNILISVSRSNHWICLNFLNLFFDCSLFSWDSPWNDLKGWLGIKHLVTIILLWEIWVGASAAARGSHSVWKFQMFLFYFEGPFPGLGKSIEKWLHLSLEKVLRYLSEHVLFVFLQGQ